MKRRVILLALMAVVATFAGCTSATEDEESVDAAGNERPQLSAGKGAISGLLVDDAFRPIPDGLVLLESEGKTKRSNANGEFTFTDLEPGTYRLRVDAEGHEATAHEVDVESGVYAEAHIMARRVVSDTGRIITQEYTVFIACSVDFVVNGIAGGECVGDLSGDSGRGSFMSDYTGIENVTYVVTEMKANQEGRWEVQIRGSNETSGETDRYAVAQFEGDYVKIVNKVGERNTVHEAVDSYGENAAFDNAWEFQTALWADNPGREEFQGAGLPVCCGVGATFGIKARFVQSVFIGEPDVNIDAYSTMS